MESSITEAKDNEKGSLNETPKENQNKNENQNQINPELLNLMKEENNKRCMDCGKENPTFVSINNGVYICERCMNNHRTFGLNISVVRSLIYDTWNDLQITYLKKGGNEYFRNLINEYYFPLNTPVYNIYRSKAAEFNRKLLKDFVLSELDSQYQNQNIVKPGIKEGIELIPESEMKYNNYNNELMGKYSNYIPPKQENLLNKVTGTFISIGDQIEKKMDQYKIAEKTKKVGNLIISNKYVQGITGKSKSLYNSFMNKVFKKKNVENNKIEEPKVQVDISNMGIEKKNENDNNITESTNYSQITDEGKTLKEPKETSLAEVDDEEENEGINKTEKSNEGKGTSLAEADDEEENEGNKNK